jgi:hypothetical protein
LLLITLVQAWGNHATPCAFARVNPLGRRQVAPALPSPQLVALLRHLVAAGAR